MEKQKCGKYLMEIDEKYVGVHTDEARLAIGAWRWQGLYDNRERILLFLEGDVLDVGGASGPIGYGDILDMEELDVWGNPVKYHDENLDKQFDTIFASHILEHYSHPVVHLRRWWGLIKKGGHIIIQVPSIYNMRNYPVFNENHKSIFVLAGDLIQGFSAGILPLKQIVEPFFNIMFLEYVANTSILFIGQKREEINGSDIEA